MTSYILQGRCVKKRGWLPKTLDLIFGVLGLLHESFLLIFGQEMPKSMCLVTVRFISPKSKVDIFRKKFFLKIVLNEDF